MVQCAELAPAHLDRCRELARPVCLGRHHTLTKTKRARLQRAGIGDRAESSFRKMIERV
jgi:hypothetical protein